jgi:LEA14-like dessication related protein
MTKRLTLVALTIALLVLAGCESLKGLLSMERPEAHLENVSLEAVTFSGASLVAEVGVTNPNPIGIQMSGFDYRLDIEGSTLVSGDQPQGLSIAANGTSYVDVPVSLQFSQLIDSVQAARDRDEVAYTVAVTLRFSLPILGEISIPLEHEGTLPVIRLPRVQLSSLRLRSIGLTGADMQLVLNVENPNGFGARIPSVGYAMEVQGQTWVAGMTDRAISLTAHGTSRVTIPFTLSFSAVGRTVRDLLVGGNSIDYEFSGVIVVNPEFELIHETEIPISLAGEIPLSR